MNINELRLGSWICDPSRVILDGDNGHQQVTSFNKDSSGYIVHYKRGRRHSGNFLKFLKPIPITSEILEKCGFKLINEHYIISHYDVDYCFKYADFRDDYGFYIEYTDSPFPGDQSHKYFISAGTRYLHQLQNLIFALTGEELKYNYKEEKKNNYQKWMEVLSEEKQDANMSATLKKIIEKNKKENSEEEIG